MKCVSKTLRARACLLVAGILVSTPASPQPKRFYKTGLDSAERGQWKQVEEMMSQAITQKPEETRRRGLSKSGYHPHYYLGLARYNLGDCAGALASWAESERQGAIVGKPQYTDLLQLRSNCEERGRPTMAGDPSAMQGSVGNRKTAKDRTRTGQRMLDKGADPASKALGALGKLAPEDSDFARATRQGQAAIEAMEAASELVDVLVLPPKKQLEIAIDAYFAGNPQRALAILEEVELDDPRARAQVHLFSAAAHFRLHVLAGHDESRLAAARESADQFQVEQWRKDFPTELFDPRFVRFLRGAR